jgi:hypothetical protein
MSVGKKQNNPKLINNLPLFAKPSNVAGKNPLQLFSYQYLGLRIENNIPLITSF